MERSNITRTETKKNQSRTIWWMPRQRLHTSNILGRIKKDISILIQSAYTNFDNNTTSCYNRILISVASLSGRKYGVQKKVVYIHAGTLNEAEYKLKLSSYRHCKKFPIHGTGQDSDNSPMT